MTDVQSVDMRRLRPRNSVLAGFVVLALIFVVGGAWSVFARISGAVIAPGTVSVESGVKTLQHPYGGVVRRIHVREGSKVRKGELLMLLEDETLQANLAIATNRLHALLAEMARLQAERERADTLRFGTELERVAERETVRRAMRTQRMTFRARRAMLAGQKDILQRKLTALENRVKGLRAELEGVRAQQVLVKEEVETVQNLFKRGQAVKPRLLRLRRMAAGLVGNEGRLIGEIARARENISEIRIQALQLDKDFDSRVLARLAEVETEVGGLRERMAELRARLARIEIRAPVAGRVLDMSVRTIGGVVVAGKPILRIVPENEPLVVQVRVRPEDIDQVFTGQNVQVYLSAFSRRKLPALDGEVRMISPAPLSGDNGMAPYYQVEITIPPSQLARLTDDLRLVPGMPVESYIRTRERSPLAIFLQPLTGYARRSLREEG